MQQGAQGRLRWILNVLDMDFTVCLAAVFEVAHVSLHISKKLTNFYILWHIITFWLLWMLWNTHRSVRLKCGCDIVLQLPFTPWESQENHTQQLFCEAPLGFWQQHLYSVCFHLNGAMMFIQQAANVCLLSWIIGKYTHGEDFYENSDEHQRLFFPLKPLLLNWFLWRPSDIICSDPVMSCR